MFHVNTNLMSTSGFKYALHQSDISQPFQYPIMSYGMFSYCRVGHHRHLHPVLRITGNVTDNRSFILFHSSPHQSTVLAFGCLIEELQSQICFSIRCFGNHQQPGSIFINPMNKPDVRVISIIIRHIFHVPGQCIHQSAVIVSVSRMYYQPCRLIHNHYILIFIYDIKRNIFRNNFIFITRTIHYHSDDIQRLHLIATLHRLAVSHNESVFGSLLNAVTRSVDNTFE